MVVQLTEILMTSKLLPTSIMFFR